MSRNRLLPPPLHFICHFVLLIFSTCLVASCATPQPRACARNSPRRSAHSAVNLFCSPFVSQSGPHSAAAAAASSFLCSSDDGVLRQERADNELSEKSRHWNQVRNVEFVQEKTVPRRLNFPRPLRSPRRRGSRDNRAQSPRTKLFHRYASASFLLLQRRRQLLPCRRADDDAHTTMADFVQRTLKMA